MSRLIVRLCLNFDGLLNFNEVGFRFAGFQDLRSTSPGYRYSDTYYNEIVARCDMICGKSWSRRVIRNSLLADWMIKPTETDDSVDMRWPLMVDYLLKWKSDRCVFGRVFKCLLGYLWRKIYDFFSCDSYEWCNDPERNTLGTENMWLEVETCNVSSFRACKLILTF